MRQPPRTELRGRNGAPIFLRSQFLTSGRRGTDRALSDSRAHRAERRSVTKEKRSRVPLGSSSSETPARTATSRAPAPCASRARTSCSSTSANCATRATRDPAASTRAAARSRGVFLGASSRRRVARARHFDARTARDAPHRDRDRDRDRDSTLRPPSATDPQTRPPRPLALRRHIVRAPLT